MEIQSEFRFASASAPAPQSLGLPEATLPRANSKRLYPPELPSPFCLTSPTPMAALLPPFKSLDPPTPPCHHPLATESFFTVLSVDP